MSEEPKLGMGVTLGVARQWLRERVRKGATCPCCNQYAKVYKRKLNSGMARSLIAMYRVSTHDWIHLPTQIGARSREEGKLRYWGLVEEESARREDGGRAGYWRLTDLGRAYVLNEKTVQKYALVYNGECMRLDGGQVSIRAALGKKFDYDELMGA